MVNIGNAAYINEALVVGVLPRHSVTMKQLLQIAKNENRLFDSSKGKRQRSVIIMRDGTYWISSMLTETVAERVEKAKRSFEDDENAENNAQDAKGDLE